MSHAVQDATRFLKTDKLEQVHVVIESQVKVFLPAEHHHAERLNVILLHDAYNSLYSPLFLRIDFGKL